MITPILQPINSMSDSTRQKLEIFYKFLEEEREIDRRIRWKREKEKEKEFQRVEKERIKKERERLQRDLGQETEMMYQDNQSMIDSKSREAGMRMDGQSIDGFSVSEERRGIGTSQADAYSSFRKQRSYNYHVHAEQRAQNKGKAELCFVCQLPGHLAKDCKFGLT